MSAEKLDGPGKLKCALFDLDGTLYDTLRANHAAYAEALRRQGIALPFESFAAGCNGRHYRDFLPGLVGQGKCSEALMEAVHREKTALYPGYLHLAAENTALFALLGALRREGWKTGLVTTASRANTRVLLGHFGRAGDFDLVLTREDVERGKPDPEGFLAAMAHFGAAPEDTIIFEDAEEGLAAARAACPNVYQVYTFTSSLRSE